MLITPLTGASHSAQAHTTQITEQESANLTAATGLLTLPKTPKPAPLSANWAPSQTKLLTHVSEDVPEIIGDSSQTEAVFNSVLMVSLQITPHRGVC